MQTKNIKSEFNIQVQERKWKEANYHYQQSIFYFDKIDNQIEVANVNLNLQTVYQLSGQQIDLDKVKEWTQILEEDKDPRAEKGHKLIREQS